QQLRTLLELEEGSGFDVPTLISERREPLEKLGYQSPASKCIASRRSEKVLEASLMVVAQDIPNFLENCAAFFDHRHRRVARKQFLTLCQGQGRQKLA